MKKAFLILCFVLFAATAQAVVPDEMLKDPALEARARVISRDLRCLVCQGQSIDDSNAELAADLRRLVRERLRTGDSDAAVLAYIQSRYGDYVLMSPPVTGRTYILWVGPLAVFLLGAATVFFRVRGTHKRGR